MLHSAPARQPESHPGDHAAWVRGAVAGDRECARRLLELVGPDVARAVAGTLGASDRDRDDVVQEALVGFLQALPAFRGQCSLRGFAMRIATRRAFDLLRRRGRRERANRGGDAPTEVADPFSATAAAQLLRRLRRCLRGLPPEQAEAVLLRWVLGHSLAEVADITGVPSNTVRSRLRLARKVLARRLAPLKGETG